MLPTPKTTALKTPENRDWRVQLNEVGVDNATIDYFGIHPTSGGYVAYSCQYPPRIDHSTNQVKFDSVERGRLLPDAHAAHPDKQRFFNPKIEDTPSGEMPFFYTPNYNDLRLAVAEDNGILYGFEGDKDTWTAYAAGIKNSAGVLSAGARIDDRLALQLQEMGVKTFRYYPDADHAGWNVAERIADILSKYSIALQVFHLPFYVNEKLIKDTSDIWAAVNFDRGEYLKTLSGLRQIKLTSQQQRETSKDGEYFDKRLYEDIETNLGFTSSDYKGNDGWPKRSIACKFEHHDHDDHHPAFAWNKTMHIARCFKCGRTWLAKEVAQQIGINWRAYVNREYENQPSPSTTNNGDYDIRQAAKPLEQTQAQDSGGVKGLQVDQALLKSMNLATDYSQLPNSAFLYTLEDAMEDYEKRFLGVVSPQYPPLMNPFRVMHSLGGLAHVLTPPVMVGILGRSGGFKCLSADTRISTVQGILPIGSFATGKPEFSDLGVEILTPDGMKLATHFYDSGVSPTKRIKTRFGYELRGTYNHPVLVLDEHGCLVWKRLDEISVGDFVAINRNTFNFGNKTRLLPSRLGNEFEKNGKKRFRKYSHPVNMPVNLDVETAYVFGLLIGDGGMTHAANVNFTTADKSLIDAFNAWLSRFGLEAVYRSKYDYSVHSTALRDWLITNGIKGYAHEKTIPDAIWTAPKSMVRAFIQGLFDTDGSAAYKDKFKVSLASSSEELAKGIHELLLQFGIISRRYFVANKFKGDWRVEMRGAEAKKFFDRIGFRLDRKQEIANHAPTRFNTNVDVVPYLPLSYENISRKRGIDGKFGNRLRHVQKGNRGISHEYLDEYRSKYPELEDVLKDHYFYDEIRIVEDAGETQCYDVTIPDGHMFVSAGFVSHNTSQLSTIINTFSMQGLHGIVFSPEWTAQRNADRIVQQFGGLRMGEMSLYQRFLYEQEQIQKGKLAAGDPNAFGVAPPKSNMDNTVLAMAAIRAKMRGKVVYVNKFGASIFDVMAMVNEAAKRMTDAGTPPSYLVFDYAQMAVAPRGFRDWDIGDTINLVKSFTIQLGLATFMASQVRKTDSDAIKEGDLLTSTSGLGLRDDAFNLFWTTNPTPEIYWNAAKTEQFKAIQIAVTKNSDGKLADDKENSLFLYAALKRLVIVDDINDPTYTFDMEKSDLEEEPDLPNS